MKPHNVKNIGEVLMRKVMILMLFVSLGFLVSCIPQRQLGRLPVSPWGGAYSYIYNPPEQKAAVSVHATIIVVNPSYKEEDSVLTNEIYKKVAKGFSASMGIDMDKVIISKGMTAKGPYKELDDITYPDKKMSDLTLAPKVYIAAETKYKVMNRNRQDSGERRASAQATNSAYDHIWIVEQGIEGGEKVVEQYTEDDWTIKSRNVIRGGRHKVRMTREFEMKISGWVAFEMREPLSGQKMWIKRLNLEETMVSGMEIYEGNVKHLGGNQFEYTAGKELFDGRTDAIADAIKKMYPVIMDKCWTYINTDEILSLKTKSKEIRDIKVY